MLILLYLSISIYNFASKPQPRAIATQYLLTVFIYINIQLCKQTTTLSITRCSVVTLYLSISIYNFASKPQLYTWEDEKVVDCIYLYQYTTLQANHNLF